MRRSLRMLAIAALIWLLAAPLSVRAALPLGGEFQANTETYGSQERPASAVAASGDFVVVWQGFDLYGLNYSYSTYWDIYCQRYNSSGTPIGTEFQVNSYTSNGQYHPDVCTSAAGEFVVVWDGYGSSGYIPNVFAQLFDSAGAAVGTEFRVDTNTSDARFPRVACQDSGDFVVVWSHNRVSASRRRDVVGRRFDALGNPLGTEFQVNTYTTWDQGYYEHDIDIARNGDGDFVVVWASHYQDGFDRGIFAQRFDSAGLPAGTEFQVNTLTSLDQRQPGVGIDRCGNFTVAWTDLSPVLANMHTDVKGMRYTATGAPLTTEFVVNSYTTYYQGYQSWSTMAADGAGNFIVAWDSQKQDAFPFVSSGTFAKMYDPAGAVVTGEFLVNTYTRDNQYHADISGNPAGQFVAVWESHPSNFPAQDGSEGGIYAQRYCSDADADGSCDAPSTLVCPSVLLDHFYCYKTKAMLGVSVTLADLFDTDVYTLGRVGRLCTPADKNAEGRFDEDTHLQSYRAKGPHARRTAVLVLNQFGNFFYDTKKTKELMVPANKAVPPNPIPPPPGAESLVDHYRCLKVRRSPRRPAIPAGIVATVDDQFGSRSIEVKRPRRLCVATDKAGEGIKQSDAHLMCYKVKPDPVTSPGDVLTSHQLGEDSLVLKRDRELCVPSAINLTCGNNTVDNPNEQCDGTDDTACPGACQIDCTCP